jgi:ribosome-associated protein
MSLIEITEDIAIREEELDFSFIRGSGPGGQHVNRAATAVQLRFDVLNSPSLPEGVRQRLVRLAGNRMTSEGTMIIEARGSRSQDRNRQEAVGRLVRLIRKAAQPPKRRRKTRPTRASQQRRLQEKRRRSEIKRRRRAPDEY